MQSLIRKQDRRSQLYRDRYEHTLRVLNWAERIQKVDGGEIAVVSLAVMFHDAGWSDTTNHAVVSADLAEKFLNGMHVEPQVVDRIVSAVKTHNLRGIPKEDLSLENRIVMDADLLDELGVTALVWDALATAGDANPGYVKVFEKDKKYYSSAAKKISQLKTETGMKLYQERLKIWGLLLENLAYELGLSDPDLK
ncbi:MAG: hypothetical protein A2X25_08220 [Chloroflexi bacterium GWB2_49_20]|nr:MAG: hypothetical protein A2X25_08220 [Chloroflexi bacterium GWB2_49_20]OGN79578.1 MAG: hypothetical protein A2X26_05805 [Chloroflexi bacterium GWC2_49_37]OGN84499.1 MAG: hypothetical protein A2X27_10725 [Chloroflexi bacterium GWD2_49_16]